MEPCEWQPRTLRAGRELLFYIIGGAWMWSASCAEQWLQELQELQELMGGSFPVETKSAGPRQELDGRCGCMPCLTTMLCVGSDSCLDRAYICSELG